MQSRVNCFCAGTNDSGLLTRDYGLVHVTRRGLLQPAQIWHNPHLCGQWPRGGGSYKGARVFDCPTQFVVVAFDFLFLFSTDRYKRHSRAVCCCLSLCEFKNCTRLRESSCVWGEWQNCTQVSLSPRYLPPSLAPPSNNQSVTFHLRQCR